MNPAEVIRGDGPGFRIGANGGVTCAPAIAVVACKGASARRSSLNGRPVKGVHAIRMELAQSACMEEAPPWTCRPGRAAKLHRVLLPLLTQLQAAVLKEA